MAEAIHKNLHILIMAGGSGTRFWPRSRSLKPKQLLALWDDKTLIEHTVDRFSKTVPHENIWIVTTESLVKPTEHALGKSAKGIRILGEPAAKNTAACILWGILEIKKTNPNAVIAVMPADHYIGNEKAFLAAVLASVDFAQESGGLITLGIKPDRPETGYGYIEVEGSIIVSKQNPKVLPIKQFVEKPDLRTAARYVSCGRFLWNAGMFIFRAQDGFNAFEVTMPSLVKTFSKLEKNGIKEVYDSISKIDTTSIDIGVMERANEKGITTSVIPVDCSWNDVGSFPALEDIGQAVRGEVVSLDAGSNVVQTDQGLVALVGVSDLVVVRDGDVVLVASKDRAQDIKAVLEKVKKVRPDLV